MKTMRFLTSLFLLIICFNTSKAQIQFQKIINAIANDQEFARSVSICNDGSYLIGGTLGGMIGGLRRPYLIKMDINGDTLWTRCYAGAFFEELYTSGQTADGGYFLAGNVNTFGSSGYDFLLLKTDSLGIIQWSKKYLLYSTNLTELCYAAAHTSDNGFILTGEDYSGVQQPSTIHIIKTDSAGNIQWQKAITGTIYDQSFSIQETTDEGYIIAGNSSPYGPYTQRMILIKLDSSGVIEWSKNYPDLRRGNSVKQTADHGFIVTGWESSDLYLLKTDSIGQILWLNKYDNGNNEWGFDVVQTTNGGYAVLGTEYIPNTSRVFLIRTDSSGLLLSSKIFSQKSSTVVRNPHLLQTADDGFLVASEVYQDTSNYYTDLYIIKTDSSGNSICNDPDPNTIVTAATTSVNNTIPNVSNSLQISMNYTMNNIIPQTLISNCVISNIETEPDSKNELRVYPNPAKNTVSFDWSNATIDELSIYSSIGNRVIHKPIGTFSKNTPIDISQLTPGLYCAYFSSKQITSTYCLKFLKID